MVYICQSQYTYIEHILQLNVPDELKLATRTSTFGLSSECTDFGLVPLIFFRDIRKLESSETPKLHNILLAALNILKPGFAYSEYVPYGLPASVTAE